MTLLREVMNTVGKYGQLGGSIRCVISVSMLTEEWDANTVTHVLGVRAFGVHANHQEAFNATLRCRCRCSAYRRLQNLYAKRQNARQRTLRVQQMIHNWVRVHFSFPKNTTPAMKRGYIQRPVSLYEMLPCRGFNALSS
jgi:hypothetical protein